jgi:hypothetical protein
MLFVKRLAALLALALAGRPALADTVDVTSTTLIRVGQETRAGSSGSSPSLDTVAPAFEMLSISARGVTNPIADDLAIVVSTWGSYELADRRWDNGTGSNLTGEVVTGYLQGRFLGRRLTLRVGREHVMTGAARMIHLDGGEAIAVLPLGVRLSAYAGVPVSQRFTTRRSLCTVEPNGQTVCGNEHSWNPAGGDIAYGGRAAWSYGFAGFPGRGIDLGVSANVVTDHGDPVRQEVAADVRLQPAASFSITGFGAYSLYDERESELGARATWSATRALRIEADAKHQNPDLLLARNSILSVFSASQRRTFGGGLFYRLARGVQVGGTYHVVQEPGREITDDKRLGHEADASLEWERGHTLLGAEVSYLDALENGYVAGRLFGRQEYGRIFAAVDVMSHFFREKVNEESMAVTGALTGGIELARGWSAVISGRAGVTPFFEQTFDVMAKLVYNQTYRIREVR